MESTMQIDCRLLRGKQNFKEEQYPEDVMADMADYIEIIDAQLGIRKGDGTKLRPYFPNLIKDYINFESRNKIDRKKFEFTFGFNSYHRKNSSMQVEGENNEIKGLYIFADVSDEGIQVKNVGISQTILRRFYQHTCGRLHNQATLAFHMANALHCERKGEYHSGRREQFPFSDYWEEIIEPIRNYRFAIVPIENNFQLYLAEVYVACHYRSYWNTFETH